ncbi:MAG: hypothetical protein H7234_01905, partial [Herminiimonas sp.]|nr:hypothetical protein [Herminiimonas sp.]
LEKITHLTLPELAVNDRTPNRLQDLTPPEVLKLKNCPGYVKALQEEETRVQELFLLPIQAITDAGLLQLQSIGQLRALDLGTCSAITGAGLAHLQRLT